MPHNAYARGDRRIEVNIVNLVNLGDGVGAFTYPVTVFLTVQISVGERKPGCEDYCPCLTGADNPQAVADQMVANFSACMDQRFNQLFADLNTGASASPGVTQALAELMAMPE